MRILVITLALISVVCVGCGSETKSTNQLSGGSVDSTVCSIEEETTDEAESNTDTEAHADCTHGEGSYHGIQHIILDSYGCTNSACHGNENFPAGGLDLSSEVAYQNLYRVNSSSNLSEPMQLIFPGEQKLSFLYTKLAAASNGDAIPTGGGSPMPVGVDPLTDDHLEALRLWIRAGAPETGDVEGVNELLGCGEGSPAVANKIAAPAPPAAGEGVQLISGPWTVPANSEKEVCFATYYDLSQTPDLLPDWALVACDEHIGNDAGSCFAYRGHTLTQDPQSHHSLITAYFGATLPSDPSWGEWTCLNGPNKGIACDPTRIGVSAATDGGANCGDALSVCGTNPVEATACVGWGAEDSRTNYVGLAGAQSPISTASFPTGVYSVAPTKGIMIWNSHAFNLTNADTTVDQYLNLEFALADQRTYANQIIFDASSIFVANVPPFEQRTYCSTHTIPQGSRLTSLSSHAHKRGILWETWLPPQDPGCTPTTNCLPNETTSDYVSRIYNDPLDLLYDPPLEYNDADIASRTLKYCVTYDNGLEHPELVKLNSTSVGTTCEGNAYCSGGDNQGAFCGSDDSVCGCGTCDACIVQGGVTTEDEMFLFLGSYYDVTDDDDN